jgi:hypothetical protein
MKSVQHKSRKDLRKEHFLQDPILNQGVVRVLEMRPTAGGEVLMHWQSKWLCISCNKKRRMTVSSRVRSVTALDCKDLMNYLFSSF